MGERTGRYIADYRNLIAHNPIMFRGAQIGKTIKMVPNIGGLGLKPIHRATRDDRGASLLAPLTRRSNKAQ